MTARSSSCRSTISACTNRRKILDFDIPYSVAELDKAAREVVRANKLTDAYVRPIAWRGSEQMGVSAQHDQHPMSPSPPGTGAPISIRPRAPKGCA